MTLACPKSEHTGTRLFNTQRDWPNVILFAQYYRGAKGNIYFVWKEDTNTPDLLSKQLNAASSICIQLPRYHSRGCKARFRKLTENLLFDRISPAEFRALYRELTGDESVSEDSVSKEVDNRIQCIMHNLDPTLARDLRINNCRKATFDKFWDICDKGPYINDVGQNMEIFAPPPPPSRCHLDKCYHQMLVVKISMPFSLYIKFKC